MKSLHEQKLGSNHSSNIPGKKISYTHLNSNSSQQFYACLLEECPSDVVSGGYPNNEPLNTIGSRTFRNQGGGQQKERGRYMSSQHITLAQARSPSYLFTNRKEERR
jgi:hypothetical protein